jgi:hypothetical protein
MSEFDEFIPTNPQPTISFPVYENIVNNPQKGLLPLAVVAIFIFLFFRWIFKN